MKTISPCAFRNLQGFLSGRDALSPSKFWGRKVRFRGACGGTFSDAFRGNAPTTPCSSAHVLPFFKDKKLHNSTGITDCRRPSGRIQKIICIAPISECRRRRSFSPSICTNCSPWRLEFEGERPAKIATRKLQSIGPEWSGNVFRKLLSKAFLKYRMSDEIGWNFGFRKTLGYNSKKYFTHVLSIVLIEGVTNWKRGT